MAMIMLSFGAVKAKSLMFNKKEATYTFMETAIYKKFAFQ